MSRVYLIISLTIISFLTQAQEKDTLLVGYTSAPPFIITEGTHMEGISFWLWNHCAKELKIDYKMVPLSFQEMLTALQNNTIDLSINPLTVTSRRMNSMDFTYPFYTSHAIVTKSHSSPLKVLYDFFSSFFSINFLSGFLILVLFIALFGFLEWYFEKEVNPTHFRSGWKGVWDGLWWSVVTMTTVGYGDKTPQSKGGKVVALIWMFRGLLFISGLSASVASTLTINRLSNTGANILDYKLSKVGTIAHSSSEEYLKDHFFKNVHVFDNVNDGLDALLHHQLDIFIYDEPIIRYRVANDKRFSSLNILPSKFKAEFYAFGLPKDSNLDELISPKIIDIIERDEWQNVLREYGSGEND